jgi:hypothetical protein
MGKITKGKLMNLSIEMKLATALGATFVALSLGAMAQTQNDSGTTGSNESALTDNATSINPSRKEFQGSSSSTTQEKAKTSLSNDTDQGPASANGKKKSKSTKRESENARVDHSHDD